MSVFVLTCTNRKINIMRWLIVLMVVVVMLLVAATWPLGPDYSLYRITASNWLSGLTRLYDEQSRQFFNTPWSMVLLVPITLLPVRIGASLLTLFSLLAIIASVHIFHRLKPLPFYAYVLALVNVPVIFLIIAGQLDVTGLLGIAAAYWAVVKQRPLLLSLAFCLIGLKPVNLVLVALLFLFAIRRWPRLQKLQVVSLPLALTVLWGFLIGFDWPLRYLQNLTLSPPVDNGTITIWKLAGQFNIPAMVLLPLALVAVAGLGVVILRRGLNDHTLSLTLATTFMVTPYAWIYHYVLLTPALFYLLRVHRGWALAAYVTTWVAASRLVSAGSVFSMEDILYPLVLFAACWLMYFQQQPQAQVDLN